MSDLSNWRVSITMARRTGADVAETRVFNAVLPAPDEHAARDGAYDFGHAVNRASRFVWKFTDEPIAVEPEGASS